ncbi:MAG: ATP-binding cassette domain-containing protein [Elusimicrobia bacterium]|nr:ATP-binding cassette domain-containing protein [Elusimicrobiota bacterium]
MISIDSLGKSFGEHPAVRIERLEIPLRRTFAVIGPSGCGKSTLLRLIMRLIKPETGTIQINGLLMDDRSCRLLRQNIGYVIQEGGLFPHLTAGQNVALMAKRLGWPGERIRSRIEEIANLADIRPEELRRYPAELSGGQRQRISLMRAIMLDPAIILLDEPLGALDPMIRTRLQNDLKRIFNQLKKTIIWVTHDMAEAAFFGHEIVLMKDGRVVQQGPLAQLLENPSDTFVTEFILAQRPPEELVRWQRR